MSHYPDRSIPGFEIISPDPPHPWALIVRCKQPQTEWRAFSDHILDKASPRGASTTIIYWDAPYRIEREVTDSEGSTYFMRPWPEHEPMFHRFELSNVHIEGNKQAQHELKLDEIKIEVSAFYDFLMGFLPSRTQIALSHSMGFDPVEATRRSAILCLLLGFSSAFFGIFIGLPPAVSFGIGLFLLLDGILRWAWIITDEKPNGLLIWELIDHLPEWLAKIASKPSPNDLDPYE